MSARPLEKDRRHFKSSQQHLSKGSRPERAARCARRHGGGADEDEGHRGGSRQTEEPTRTSRRPARAATHVLGLPTITGADAGRLCWDLALGLA